MLFRTALLSATLLAPAAFAEAPAAIWPTRDVVVTYAEPGEGGDSIQMAFSAKPQLMRMEMGGEGYGIIDHAARQMTMVMPGQRMFMTVEAPDELPVSLEMGDYTFTRVGTRTVAGASCTDWRVAPRTDPDEEAVVCLTDDGVMLRLDGGDDDVVEATAVDYRKLDPALFRVPEGFTRMELPPGMTPPVR